MKKKKTSRTYKVLSGVKPDAVVVYCSDPRFQTTFRKFTEGEIGLAEGKYIPFVVAGGAGALARPETMPKEFKFMRRRLELFINDFISIRRIILINHEDCAYYRDLSKKALGAAKKGRHLARTDLKKIAEIFRKILAFPVRIELYYARFANRNRTLVTFEEVK